MWRKRCSREEIVHPGTGVLLAILVVMAVVSGYVLLFSMPLNEKIQTLGQEIMESEDLKTQLESRWSQQQLTEQLKKQEGDVRYMPEYDNLQAVMVELNTILADWPEYSLAFQPDDPEDAIYARQATIPFTCGSYDQARDVLQRLHDSPLRNLITDVQITEQDDGSVKATATMLFFEYQTDFQPAEKEETTED